MKGTSDQDQSPLLHAGDEQFWQSLNPDLHISRFPLSDIACYKTDAAIVEQCRSRILKEGYFQAPPVISREKAERLSRVVIDFDRRNIAPVFAFIYDEFWQIFCGLNPLMRSLLGDGYRMTPTEIWVWHIKQSASAAGWGPHRDMPGLDSVREDNTPRIVNTWIPLTDATPSNSCMYVLPTNLDANIPDKMDKSYRPYIKLQDIRALPAEAGSALGWNTRILHWGGRSSEYAEQPRISVAMYFESKDLNLYELENADARKGRDALTIDETFEMPFEKRLGAIAGGIDIYGERMRRESPEAGKYIDAFAEKYLGT
jgi:hypothetical protein